MTYSWWDKIDTSDMTEEEKKELFEILLGDYQN